MRILKIICLVNLLIFLGLTVNCKAQDNSTEIFAIVETSPTYNGGDEARLKFLSQNLKYPAIAIEKGTQGTVYVSFVIEKDGSISNITLKRDIGNGCGDEAIRVVKMMPKWIPGKQQGKLVRVQFIMPISFKLSK
ncbi:MAG: energy transducer TonB [Bacteroidota bacterium]